jgi:hypothetical protein
MFHATFYMYWGEMEGVGQGISYQLGLHSLNLGRLSGILL